MKKAASKRSSDGMRPEYDFSSGIRGKYAGRFSEDSVLVLLDPDVARLFPDAKSVNEALRALGLILRAALRRATRRRASRQAPQP